MYNTFEFCLCAAGINKFHCQQFHYELNHTVLKTSFQMKKNTVQFKT